MYICEQCIELAGTVAGTGNTASTQLGSLHAVPEQDTRARCSLCGKHRYQVTGLAAMPVETSGKVSGPVAICLECLALCNEIIVEELA